MSEKNKSSSLCDLHTCLLINPRPEEEHPDDNPRYADILLPRDARLLVSKNELTVELERTSEEVEFPTNVKNPYCNEVMDDILKIHRFTVDSNWIGLEFLSMEHPFLWFKFPTAEDVDKLIAVITSYQENIDILCAMSNYNEYMSDIVRRRRISRMRPAGRRSAKSVIVSSRPSVPSNPINSFHQMDEHVLDQVKPEPELKSDTSSMLPSSPEKTLKLKDAVIRAAPEVRTRRPRTKSAIEIATMLAVDIMSPRRGNAQEQKFLVDEPSLNEALRPETAPDVLKNPKMEIEVTPSTQPVTMNTMKSLQNCESIDMDALFTYLERVPSTKNIWQLIVLESETRRFVEERILFSYINGVREVLWHTQLDLLKFDKRKATEFQLLRGHGRSANLLAEGLDEFNPEIVHAENITQNGLQLMKTVDEVVRTKLTISPIDYSARKERLETTECAHWEMRLREREEAVWHKIQAQMDSLCAAARKAEEESKMYQEKLRDEMTLAKRQMEELTNLREREETVLHHARQKEGELHQKIRKLSAELKSYGGKVSFDPPSSSESSRSTNSSSASHQTESTSFLKRLF